MKPERYPLATALHQAHKNGDQKTKERVREIIELMRRLSK